MIAISLGNFHAFFQILPKEKVQRNAISVPSIIWYVFFVAVASFSVLPDFPDFFKISLVQRKNLLWENVRHSRPRPQVLLGEFCYWKTRAFLRFIIRKNRLWIIPYVDRSSKRVLFLLVLCLQRGFNRSQFTSTKRGRHTSVCCLSLYAP